MPTLEGDRNWGDLYLGLHLAAQTCEGLATVSAGRSMFVLEAQRVSLGMASIWDPIADFCKTALWWLKPWNVGPWVWTNWLRPGVQWLRTHLLEPALEWGIFWLGWVLNWAARLYAGVVDWAKLELDSVKMRIDGMRNSLWSRYFPDRYPWRPTWADIWNHVIGRITGTMTMIENRINAIPGALRDRFDDVLVWGQAKVDQLVKWWDTTGVLWINRAWQSILDLPETLRVTFLKWWTTAGLWVERARLHWNTVIWPFILNLPQFLYDTATSWLVTAYTLVVNWLRSLWEGILDTAQKAIDRATPVVREWIGAFEELPALYLNWVATTAGTDLALNPGKALATAGSLYSMAIAAGTTAHVTSAALNIIPALNWVGASQLAAYVAQVAGFEPLTDATYGTLINDVLTVPLRYHWNEMLRPRIPTEGGIFIMGRKRGLNRAEFGAAMAKQGLPDWWIDREYQFFWTDPSPYWLLRMSEYSTPQMRPSALFLPWLAEWLPNWRSDPWAWFKMKLMLSGFEDTDIPAFIDGFQSRRLGPAVTQIKTSVRAMIREAYWGRAEAQGALRPVGVRQEEIEYIILAEDIDYQNRYNDDQVRYYSESFRKGEISAQDLSLMLSTFIVRPERVAQIVARERVRMRPKTSPIVTDKVHPLLTSLIRQAMNSWTKVWRAYEIEEAELLLGLTIVVQDDVLARQLVDVELTRYRPPPPEPPPPLEDPLVQRVRLEAISFWIKQFRDGLITADMLELGLANLIVDPEIVRLMRDIEEQRARRAAEILPLYEEDPLMAKVREETIRGHIEMFRKRLIGLDELYLYLVQDGLAQLLAQATVLTQALKRVKSLPADSPYFVRDAVREVIDEAIETYSDMVMRGEISLEEVRANLAGVGVDPDLVTYLVDTLEVRLFAAKWGL